VYVYDESGEHSGCFVFPDDAPGKDGLVGKEVRRF
jgi:hypothetical protein